MNWFAFPSRKQEREDGAGTHEPDSSSVTFPRVWQKAKNQFWLMIHAGRKSAPFPSYFCSYDTVSLKLFCAVYFSHYSKCHHNKCQECFNLARRGPQRQASGFRPRLCQQLTFCPSLCNSVKWDYAISAEPIFSPGMW